MQNFHVFTMVWGSHHIDLFKRGCFKSLNWPLNRSALDGHMWCVYTRKEHFEEIQSIFKDSPFKLVLAEIGDVVATTGCGVVPRKQCDDGVVLLNGLRGQIFHSIKNNSKVLMAPPDTIFGDGTVQNLLKIGSSQKTCVAVSHPRVLPKILDEIDYHCGTKGAVSNARLCKMSFENAHDSWVLSDLDHEKNRSYVGGIAWKKLSTDLYTVQHRLPTNYYCGFTESDWDFWWSQTSFGSFDHRWPAENLIRQERQRYVGSSDACFIVEVTEWDKNVPPEIDKSKIAHLEKDAYWTNHYHNGINRQTSVIFRAE